MRGVLVCIFISALLLVSVSPCIACMMAFFGFRIAIIASSITFSSLDVDIDQTLVPSLHRSVRNSCYRYLVRRFD